MILAAAAVMARIPEPWSTHARDMEWWHLSVILLAEDSGLVNVIGHGDPNKILLLAHLASGRTESSRSSICNFVILAFFCVVLAVL